MKLSKDGNRKNNKKIRDKVNLKKSGKTNKGKERENTERHKAAVSLHSDIYISEKERY